MSYTTPHLTRNQREQVTNLYKRLYPGTEILYQGMSDSDNWIFVLQKDDMNIQVTVQHWIYDHSVDRLEWVKDEPDSAMIPQPFTKEELHLFDLLGLQLHEEHVEATGQTIEDWIYDE